MARKSSIDRLDQPIKEMIGQLLQQNHTLDEILTHLAKMDVEVSRSALGRHSKKVSQVAEMINRSRMIATAITDKYGDEESAKVSRINLEIMHSLINNLMLGGEEGDPVTLDPKDAMFLATALEKLGKADTAHIANQINIAEERARKETKEKAVEAAGKVARSQGLSAETVDAIKAKILGVE